MLLSLYGLKTFLSDLMIYEYDTLLKLEHNEQIRTLHFNFSVM